MMRRGRVLLVVFGLVISLYSQEMVETRRSGGGWTCNGKVWAFDGRMYCSDLRTREVAKRKLGSAEASSALEKPKIGRSSHAVAITEDEHKNLYLVDGRNIHLYSSTGHILRSISTDVILSTGIAVLDSNHIFVAGHLPPRNTGLPSTIFQVGANGVERSFSRLFFDDVSGPDDLVLNSQSSLALDLRQNLLYQLPTFLYEIRVFNLQGEQIRTISPPNAYQTRRPDLLHASDGGVSIEPSDMLNEIAITPNGRVVVLGTKLEQKQQLGLDWSAEYSTFVDVYNPDGKFVKRISGKPLMFQGCRFRAMNQASGTLYFGCPDSVLEAEIR